MQRMEKLSQMRPIFLFFIASDQFFSSDIGLGWGWDKKIIVNEFKGFVDVDVGFFWNVVELSFRQSLCLAGEKADGLVAQTVT